MAMQDFLAGTINGRDDPTLPRPRARTAAPVATQPAAQAPVPAGDPGGFSIPPPDGAAFYSQEGPATPTKLPPSAKAPSIPVFNPTGPSALSATAPNFSTQAPVIPAPASVAGAAPNLTSPPARIAAALPAVAAGAVPGATDDSARSQSGRSLGYGKQINGVATFSDGSSGLPGVNGSIPRTMSDAQITDLGKRINTISDANFVAPAPGVATSMATGGAVTPALGDIQRPVLQGGFDPGSSVADAQRGAESDIASILNKDPRSALGIAARNASLDFSHRQFGGRGASRVGGASPYDIVINGMINHAAAPVANAQASAITGMQQGGENARAALNAETQRFDAAIRRPEAPRIPLADGTVGQLGPDGIARPVLGLDGQPVQERVGKPAVDTAAYGKILEANVGRVLGTDPITGMIKDTKTGKLRQPTPDEIATATDKAHELTERAFGMQSGAGKSAVQSAVPPQAAQLLKQNPQHRAQFEAKYGKQAAAAVLGS